MALIYLACGLLLACNFKRVGATWFIAPESWLDSPFLPVWVGAVLYGLSAVRARRPAWQESLMGLGVTGPPYVMAYCQAARYLSPLASTLVLLMAVSGAVLSPACSWLVTWCRALWGPRHRVE